MKHRTLTSRHSIDNDHLIVKIKVAFDRVTGKSFEDDVCSLLDAIGVRPGTACNPLKEHEPFDVCLIHFDEEELAPPSLTRGVVEFGVPTSIVPAECGLPLAIAVATYGSVYSFVREYQVLDIDFPEPFIAGLPGPTFGDSFIPKRSKRSTRLGLILKPRFVSDEGTLRRLVTEFGGGGLDYVVDDELTVGTSTLPFTSRVRAMVQEVKRVEDKVGKRLPYIANITATYLNALEFAWEAKELGAAGVMVNTVAMGYDAVAQLATSKDFGLGIFANSIGRGVLTSGPGYRIAPAFLCKLARLAGADGVYTGPLVGSIDNVRQYSASYCCSLTEPFHHGCRRRHSAAIMSGGISLPELLNNEVLYDGPLYLSLGRGLVNPIVEGISGSIVLDCIRTLWDALVEGNIKDAKALSKRLAKKGPDYVKCLRLIRADDALDIATKG